MKSHSYHKKGANVEDLLNIKEAGHWASEHLGKRVTSSNISYLIRISTVAKNRRQWEPSFRKGIGRSIINRSKGKEDFMERPARRRFKLGSFFSINTLKQRLLSTFIGSILIRGNSYRNSSNISSTIIPTSSKKKFISVKATLCLTRFAEAERH